MIDSIVIEFQIHGNVTKINYEKGDSLLEAAMRNGLNPSYSCLEGVCAACKAKVVSGKVDFSEDTILDEGEANQGFVLTCRARPRAGESHIVVSYDIG